MLPIADRMQATLVAFYGAKPEPFLDLIRGAQGCVAETLGAAFAPYEPGQVHGTIVGLEGQRFADRVINRNYLEHRRELRLMDPQTILGFARSIAPLEIQVGGYADGVDYGFESRDEHPHVRSFAIQRGSAVAMGWPVDRTEPLDRLRRRFGGMGALHKEHKADKDMDDDFYFVLGSVDGSAEADGVERTQAKVRQWLSTRPGVRLRIDPAALSVVGYVDPRLPPTTSCKFGILDRSLSSDVLLSLYPPA